MVIGQNMSCQHSTFGCIGDQWVALLSPKSGNSGIIGSFLCVTALQVYLLFLWYFLNLFTGTQKEVTTRLLHNTRYLLKRYLWCFLYSLVHRVLFILWFRDRISCWIHLLYFAMVSEHNPPVHSMMHKDPHFIPVWHLHRCNKSVRPIQHQLKNCSLRLDSTMVKVSWLVNFCKKCKKKCCSNWEDWYKYSTVQE